MLADAEESGAISPGKVCCEGFVVSKYLYIYFF